MYVKPCSDVQQEPHQRLPPVSVQVPCPQLLPRVSPPPLCLSCPVRTSGTGPMSTRVSLVDAWRNVALSRLQHMISSPCNVKSCVVASNPRLQRGNCTALVLTAPHGGRCRTFCSSFGHICVAAAEEENENCEASQWLPIRPLQLSSSAAQTRTPAGEDEKKLRRRHFWHLRHAVHLRLAYLARPTESYGNSPTYTQQETQVASAPAKCTTCL